MSQTIAIVGLGKVGSVFLQGLLAHGKDGLAVTAVAENGETEGKALARSKGIPVLDTEALIAKGEAIDILFDLTGVPEVRQSLREKLMAANNRHTIIATETVARLVWSLLASDQALPAGTGKSGY